MILVTFVDDCGLSVHDPSKVYWFITELQTNGFELHLEGDFTAFLGVAVDPQPNGSIHMHQSKLIKKIIAAAKMDEASPNWTPAPMSAFGSDPEGTDYDQKSWKYSSIVGMLIYVCTNTRPDISFTVSQVAKYCTSPEQSHTTAVKPIIRYLKRTSEKGIYINFTGRLDMVDYVNADFAGLFGSEHNPRNPDIAES
jgi:hypothetical protein